MLIPNRFLFDFEFRLRYRRVPPPVSGDVSDWTDDFLLPRLGSLEGQEEFADVWACWNEHGLHLACRVTGKIQPVHCNPKSYWTSDTLRVCTDMRDARTNRRATRFCQQFYFLPSGGGKDKKSPVAGVAKIQRARADAPTVAATHIAVAASVTQTGYSLTAHIPTNCLSGFDPAEHPRIGFYYIVEDRDHGQQYLTVGDDLYWYVDPSTWATAVLSASERSRGSRRGSLDRISGEPSSEHRAQAR